MREASREAGELAVVLNKADQVSPGHLQEVAEFTRQTIAAAVHRPIERFFLISALEHLTTRTATRDWGAFEFYLRQLSSTARERLVDHAGDRAVARLARRAVHELTRRQDALRQPLVELERRAARVRQALVDLDQSLVELRFRFDAAEADLGRRFAHQRIRFIESTSQLRQTLLAWIDARAASGRSLRRLAFAEARRLGAVAVDQWFDTAEPEANELYREATGRFVTAANDCVGRVAADAADLDVEELPTAIGFRMRRRFFFTHLMHTTATTPITWVIDRFAPSRIRTAHVARAAAAYLTHLLETNSHRVENDFRDRTRESRRWLEAQIRARLAGALGSAERAAQVAAEKQHMSEAETDAALRRLEELRGDLLALDH